MVIKEYGQNANRRIVQSVKTESEVIIMKKTDKENAKMFCDAIRAFIWLYGKVSG